MRYFVTVCSEPEGASELWENHTYELEAPDEQELKQKIRELLDSLIRSNPRFLYSVQKIVNRSFRYVAQFASFFTSGDPHRRWEKDQEIHRWDIDLKAQSDADARTEAQNWLEVYPSHQEQSSSYTRLIKILKITEEVVPPSE